MSYPEYHRVFSLLSNDTKTELDILVGKKQINKKNEIICPVYIKEVVYSNYAESK